MRPNQKRQKVEAEQSQSSTNGLKKVFRAELRKPEKSGTSRRDKRKSRMKLLVRP